MGPLAIPSLAGHLQSPQSYRGHCLPSRGRSCFPRALKVLSPWRGQERGLRLQCTPSSASVHAPGPSLRASCPAPHARPPPPASPLAWTPARLRFPMGSWSHYGQALDKLQGFTGGLKDEGIRGSEEGSSHLGSHSQQGRKLVSGSRVGVGWPTDGGSPEAGLLLALQVPGSLCPRQTGTAGHPTWVGSGADFHSESSLEGVPRHQPPDPALALGGLRIQCLPQAGLSAPHGGPPPPDCLVNY